MKNYILLCLIIAMGMVSQPAFSQTEKDTTLLNLPGDNLDLYAVLDLFQKSKTIEQFEETLNLEKTKINNLDLDLDGKVDFIKVVTKKEDDDFSFILQIAVSKTENQDVAVIFVTKEKDKKMTMQIVGDPDLYGKNYIVELKESKTPAVTPNPGYTGTDTVVVAAPAKTTVVIVEQAPIVQYVYSPVYVPYYPPYYYGYYPPYYRPYAAISVGIYFGYHASYHHGGYGYHGNTTIIHNTNNYNNYNNSRNTSNTVRNNNNNGNYNRGNTATTRPSNGASTRPSGGASTRPSAGTMPSNGASSRPSTGASPSTRPSNGASSSGRPTASPSTQPSKGSSSSGRPSASPSTRPSNNSQARPSSSGSSRYNSGGGGSRSSGGFNGGGGGSRGGGGRGGGGRR